MALQNCDLTTALRSLENSAGIYIPTYALKELPPQPPAIEIQRVRSLSDPRLLYYLKSRSISPEIAFRYCREVYYKTRGERVYFAVGFRNDGGGWELRNSRFKISTSPKTISTLSCGSDTVAVFEGFMDYLSYMSMRRERRPGSDAIVLNSVSNLSKAMSAIASHTTILTYLDNDEAGRRTMAEIRRQAEGRTVIDRSELYKEYNDLNDYWMAHARNVGIRIIR